MIVEDLRKSILMFAFSGKLVSNISNIDISEELSKKTSNDWEYSTKQKITLLPINKSDELFEIPDNWKWIRLHQICSYIQRGKSPKYSNIEKYPVVAQKCNQWDGLHMDKALFFDPDELSKYSKERFLQDDDLLINSTGGGSCGRVGLYNKEYNDYELAVADSHITVCRFYKDIANPKYVYYYLSSPMVQSVIESQAVGTTNQIELMIDTVRNYLIPLPPIDIQHSIVEKIELFFQQLEEIKPLETELLNIKKKFGNEFKYSILSYAFQGYLNNNSSKRKEYNINDIKFSLPETWELKRFSDLNLINTGIAKYEGEKDYYSTGSISENEFTPEGTYDFLNKPSRANRIAILNSIIEARMMNTYKATIVDSSIVDSLLSTGFFQIGESDRYLQKYIYYYLMSFEFRKQKNSLCTGTTQKSISDTNLKKIAIPLPEISAQRKIVEIIENILPLCDDINNLIN